MMAGEGYEVTKNSKGQVVVTYLQRTASLRSWSEFIPTFTAAMQQIADVLEAKGYELDIIDNSFIVTKAGA